MAKKVLFVDDDIDFRNEQVAALKNAGFDVTEAESGEQGRELVVKQPFDVVVTDLTMEHADSGFTLCYHLKKDFPEMPVILVNSANGELTGIEFSLDTMAERSWIKADAMLNKPLRSEQLVTEIERLLGMEVYY